VRYGGAKQVSGLKSARIEAALDRAVSGGGVGDLFEQLDRSSGLPGPRPNLELARAAGVSIAAKGQRADAVLRALAASEGEYSRVVAAAAFAARRAVNADVKGSMEALQELAEDSRHHVRAGVVDALRSLIEARGDEAVAELAAWTDGYLQAHIVLEALADRTLLSRVRDGQAVLERLEEAFDLADASPRSAERSQGMRLLRQAMPAQITVFAGRFPEVIDWLLSKAEAKRPETRDIVAATIDKLRRSALSDAAAARIQEALTKSAPPPRDPSRIVHGTRKRAKGRR
jgi:hypothetical protein